ncbi:MAG: hypothetical protein HRT47_05170 [Candidatus Caenarcaniphilales bacterium]|nr:hypothetical protein [Candidatus Caenarcaniphilales bacterium]
MNAVVDAAKGIGAKLFNQASTEVSKQENSGTKVNEQKVTEADKTTTNPETQKVENKSDGFISKQELGTATQKAETSPVQNESGEGQVLSEQEVNQTWNKVGNTIKNETAGIEKTEATLKKVDENNQVVDGEKTSLGGETTIQGTDITVNTLSTPEQYGKIATELAKNGEIIDKVVNEKSRNIDLSSTDPEVIEHNKKIQVAYENMYKIDQQLKEYQEKIEANQKIAEKNRLDEINKQEEKALENIKALRKSIANFHAEKDSTITLSNGANLTNNAVKFDGKGIQELKTSENSNLADNQVAIQYKQNVVQTDDSGNIITDSEGNPKTKEKTIQHLVERVTEGSGDNKKEYTVISNVDLEVKGEDGSKYITGSGNFIRDDDSSDGEVASNSLTDEMEKDRDLKVKARAFDTSSGKEVKTIEEGDSIPTNIEVGKSKTVSEIEQSLNNTEILSEDSNFDELQNDKNYRERITYALENAKTNDTTYWANRLKDEKFDPTKLNVLGAKSLRDSINRALVTVAPAPEKVTGTNQAWFTNEEKVRTFDKATQTPTEEYRLTLTPDQKAVIQTALAGHNKEFNLIKDNSSKLENGNTLVTLNEDQYKDISTELLKTDLDNFTPEKTQISLNLADYEIPKDSSEAYSNVSYIDTSKIDDDTRRLLANQYAKEYKFGTNPLDPKENNYQVLLALRNGGSVQASVLEDLINKNNSDTTTKAHSQNHQDSHGQVQVSNTPEIQNENIEQKTEPKFPFGTVDIVENRYNISNLSEEELGLIANANANKGWLNNSFHTELTNTLYGKEYEIGDPTELRIRGSEENKYELGHVETRHFNKLRDRVQEELNRREELTNGVYINNISSLKELKNPDTFKQVQAAIQNYAQITIYMDNEEAERFSQRLEEFSNEENPEIQASILELINEKLSRTYQGNM